MKAMILAAGRGERMRPLSDATPKPLLKVGPESLIERHLHQLAKIGVSQAIINIAYQSKMMMDLLGDGHKYGIEIIYSYEENGPYGTGGGIFQALPLLGSEPFFLISSDIWSNFPLENLAKKMKGEAHLVMVENPSFHPEGDFCLSASGEITLNTPKVTYASMAMIDPKLFEGQKSGCYSLAPILTAAILRGQVTGELYSGLWYNIGTPQQLGRVIDQYYHHTSRDE
jgi:MurNAc alpha-1-phosphate uridylyltransferase